MHTCNNNLGWRKYLILSILSTLSLSTVLRPLGYEEAFSHILFPIWAFLVIVYLIFYRDSVRIYRSYGYYFALSILLLSIVLGSIKVLIIGENIQQFYNNILLRAAPKMLFLILFYILISNLSREQVLWIVNKVVLIFIVTIPVSLVMYSIFPLERFVFYIEGSAYRFSSFAFELVNFSYLAFLSSVVMVFNFYRKRSLIKGRKVTAIMTMLSILILSYAVYVVTISNYVPIFIGSIIASYLIYFKSKLAYFLYVVYFILLLLLLLFIQDMLGYTNELSYLFPRSGLDNANNGPIFFRMYRHIVAIDIFWRDFLALPYGIFNGGIDLKVSDLLNSRWSGGSGLSKIFMDLGFLIVPFLSLIILALLRAYKRVNSYNSNDLIMFFIINLSFIYGYLQAGFFNFTVSGIFILSLKYFRLI